MATVPNHSLRVSATVPDWERERPIRSWDPPRRLLAAIRRYQHHANRGNAWSLIARRVIVVKYRIWSMITGAEIHLNTEIAGGLLIPHPNGIVIHPSARIGPNCLIFQQVTIGEGGRFPGVPTLGGHVDVGAGAKILGGVTIGDHAKIGANAVVLEDIPTGVTAVGIPAKVISHNTAASVSTASDKDLGRALCK